MVDKQRRNAMSFSEEMVALIKKYAKDDMFLDRFYIEELDLTELYRNLYIKNLKINTSLICENANIGGDLKLTGLNISGDLKTSYAKVNGDIWQTQQRAHGSIYQDSNACEKELHDDYNFGCEKMFLTSRKNFVKCTSPGGLTYYIAREKMRPCQLKCEHQCPAKTDEEISDDKKRKMEKEE